jgi:hypothetical protein
LLHELLRRLHIRADKTDTGSRDLRSEISSLRRTSAAHQSDIDRFYELFHRIEDRLDRIEARLDLRDFNEAAQTVYDPNS